jgi:DNA-binding transcriptional MerR regulator
MNSIDIKLIMAERVYKVKETEVPTRTIHHWKNEGLLFEEHKKNEKNLMMKFSLSEYFWIKVIHKCRDFGLSINQIKKVKEDIIDKVKSYDEKLEEKHQEIIRGIRESFKGQSEEKIQKEISETLKYLKYVDLKVEEERNHFKEVLEAVLIHRKPCGILIYNDGEIQTDIYIEGDGFANNNMMKKFLRTHLYISIDSIFVELGLSNHFKHTQLLSNEEISSIKYIQSALKYEKPKNTEIHNKDSSIKSIETAHGNPEAIKKAEEYKKQIDNDLNYNRNLHMEKPNLFDFHYTWNYTTTS